MNLKAQIHVLSEVKNLLHRLNTTAFITKNSVLFGGTIGEHFRHIIEFYICFFEQKKTGVVNYDLRNREPILEKKLTVGIKKINEVIEQIKQLEKSTNKSVFLDNCLNAEDKMNPVQTSFYRELSYCMDHCVHHQNLIKIALQEQGLLHLIDKNFGVAFSTQKYRQECA